jgi:hypothetical protein
MGLSGKLMILSFSVVLFCSNKQTDNKYPSINDNTTTTIATTSSSGNDVYSATDGLRIRSMPDVIYGTVIGKINKGERADAIYRTKWNSKIDGIVDRWIKIRFADSEGWVFGGYLQPYQNIDIPVSSELFHLSQDLVLKHINQIINNRKTKYKFPSEKDKHHKIISTGYATYSNILFWTDESTLYAFNGEETIAVVNLNIYVRNNDIIVGPCFNYNENKLCITESGGRFGGFIMDPSLIIDLSTGKIEKDDYYFDEMIMKKRFPFKDSLYLLMEGYSKLYDGILYGAFALDKELYIYNFDGSSHHQVTKLPKAYYDYGLEIYNNHSIFLYRPKDGWADEDTNGPYLTILYDFNKNQIIQESTIRTNNELFIELDNIRKK